MAYFTSYWYDLAISATLCLHQMAAVGFKPMNIGFRDMAPTHCAIKVDDEHLIKFGNKCVIHGDN